MDGLYEASVVGSGFNLKHPKDPLDNLQLSERYHSTGSFGPSL
jgi:hypothetical protein